MNAALMNNPIEDFSFTVRVVRSLEDLQKVATLGYQAYARHAPEFATQLTTPEATDTDLNTLVLLVESKNNTTAGVDGQRARDALFKAFCLICQVLRVDKMVVCARFPVHKRYLGLLFEDVFSSAEYIEMAHIGHVPHRLLMLQVDQVEPIWRENNHSLYPYFFQTGHPDIDVAINSMSGHSQ